MLFNKLNILLAKKTPKQTKQKTTIDPDTVMEYLQYYLISSVFFVQNTNLGGPITVMECFKIIRDSDQFQDVYQWKKYCE